MSIQDELDDISPSFCIAKWKQVTMHLQNGHTHSCHHPTTHVIPITEIKTNPTALHNTEYKKQQRKLMLEGKRPSECEYCWRVEDSGGVSDRIYKSASEDWALPYLNDIVTKPWDDNVNPSYVEVNFSNVCNFKCSYCAPHISSQWMEEIERHGPYPTSTEFNKIDESRRPIPNNQPNPYVDAFWEWFPKMYRELKQFRITGGEPLLNKNTFKVLDYVIENPNPRLILNINTNLNVPEDLFDVFISKLEIIQKQNKVKRVYVFTSAEAANEQAEYIRYGMNYKQWLVNLERLSNSSIRATVMATYNILSLFSFNDLLVDLDRLRKQYQSNFTSRVPILLDVSYLQYPYHQSALLLPKDMLYLVEDQIKLMVELGYNTQEIEKVKRIYELIHSSNKDMNVNRKDFVLFVDEHDRRRNTNFLKVFPEFEDMYVEWKHGH